MNFFQYIIKSFQHFLKLNLSVILGVALSTAILLGAFVIGDSVNYSLQQITLDRLGQTDYVITAGERLFRAKLANDLSQEGLQTTSILRANGMAILNGGEARVNQLQVWGVDDTFNTFAETDSLFNLKPSEAVVNKHLAEIMGLKAGQELLIRVNKISAFPSNTPFVSAEETTISFRITVKAIASIKQTGNFNLQNIQSSPKNIFISNDWLNDQLELANKANVILIHSEELNESALLKKLSTSWETEDINLKIRQNDKLGFTEVISDRVFIEPKVETFLTTKLPNSYPVFTYFVNQFETTSRSTPYSFVTGLPDHIAQLEENEIILNKWMAEDLKAAPGDSIQLKYFIVAPLRKLNQKSAWFRVKEVVELKNRWADPWLMPEIPGLSDAGHCRDWETGIPVDLTSIRQKDEDYWNNYKGTPKAFVNLQTAKKLWKNRFGASTAIRVDKLEAANIEEIILSDLSPTSVGFQITAVKNEGLKAANGGVDFGELFIGLSFFVLFAALLLAYLMFQLYLNFRRSEVATLQAIGFPARKIRLLILVESCIIVLIGIILGIPTGLAYNSLIIEAINSIWVDIVQTSILHIHITSVAILKAFIVVTFISLTTILLILRKFARKSSQEIRQENSTKIKTGWFGLISGAILIIGSFLILFFNQDKTDPTFFFISGFTLLPGFIFLLNALFILKSTTNSSFKSFNGFIFQRIINNRKRNMLLVSFLSIGIFLVLSTGLNRKDLTQNADQPSSGTGGYSFFAETSLPILLDLNSKEGQFEFGLEESDLQFVQFRALSGDDASCLNLNRVSRPRIIGFNPQLLDAKQAFTFASRTNDLNAEHPWLSLNKALSNKVIPAIADETVIKWGLGKSVGDTLIYQNENGENLVLKLIGGIANSVFQGNILISEDHFLEHFPSVSGSQIFLISGKENSEETLKASFRNYGMELTPAKDRLLQFYQIENTYLNIFLQLGALGLLIGTIGLGIVIFRNMMEKRAEFALMQATGFHSKRLFKLVLVEHLIVVLTAIFVGTVPAIISAFPSLRSSLYEGLIYQALFLILMVLISAGVWIFIASKLVMKSTVIEALKND